MPSVAFFTLQYRVHGLETCRIKPWIAAVEFDDELIARAWKRDKNKIGVQDRDQCGKNAVTDLARIVVLPRRGKCRERDEAADARPQLILVAGINQLPFAPRLPRIRKPIWRCQSHERGIKFLQVAANARQGAGNAVVGATYRG
jgi:hypothetical protein